MDGKLDQPFGCGAKLGPCFWRHNNGRMFSNLEQPAIHPEVRTCHRDGKPRTLPWHLWRGMSGCTIRKNLAGFSLEPRLVGWGLCACAGLGLGNSCILCPGSSVLLVLGTACFNGEVQHVVATGSAQQSLAVHTSMS